MAEHACTTSPPKESAAGIVRRSKLLLNGTAEDRSTILDAADLIGVARNLLELIFLAAPTAYVDTESLGAVHAAIDVIDDKLKQAVGMLAGNYDA